MSAQYKIKKYMNKLEKANSVEEMDAYFRKVKQHKFSQSGGALQPGPWRTDLQEKYVQLDNISKIQVNLKDVVDTQGKTVTDIGQKVKDFTEKFKNVEESLSDSLLFLKEITDKIKDKAIDLEVLEPLIQSISQINFGDYEAIDPTMIWELISKSPNATYDELREILDKVNKLGTKQEREDAIEVFNEVHAKKQ
jgi:hypothetical protein